MLPEFSTSVVLKVWSMVQQLQDQHHLGTCQKCRFFSPLPQSHWIIYSKVAVPKSVGFLLLLFCFVFWPHHTACGILVTRPGTEPRSSAVRARSPNHWTTREFPLKSVLNSHNICSTEMLYQFTFLTAMVISTHFLEFCIF